MIDEYLESRCIQIMLITPPDGCRPIVRQRMRTALKSSVSAKVERYPDYFLLADGLDREDAIRILSVVLESGSRLESVYGIDGSGAGRFVEGVGLDRCVKATYNVQKMMFLSEEECLERTYEYLLSLLDNGEGEVNLMSDADVAGVCGIPLSEEVKDE